MSDDARDFLTLIILFGVVLPSIIFAGLTAQRINWVLSLARDSYRTIRKRFLYWVLSGGIMAASYFLVLQNYLEIPDPLVTKPFLFCIGFVAMLEMFGWAFLAWDLWWTGIRPNTQSRWMGLEHSWPWVVLAVMFVVALSVYLRSCTP